MEQRMLRKLKYELAVATEKTFIRRFQRAAAAHVEDNRTLVDVVLLSNYLVELTLQEYHFVNYLPSLIATAAVCVALSAFTLPPWVRSFLLLFVRLLFLIIVLQSPTMEHYTQYRWGDEQLQACMRDLIAVYHRAPHNPLTGVFLKHSTARFSHIATRPLLASTS